MCRRHKTILFSLIGVVSFILCWDFFVILKGNPGLFPPSSQVLQALLKWIESGLFFTDIWASLPRALLAVVLALPIGILIGLALGLSSTFNSLFGSLIHFSRSLPPVALLPLFVIWFGIDWDAKLSTAIFVCIFPIAVTTASAAKVAALQYAVLAKDLNLNSVQYLFHIILPSSLPSIVPGIRLSISTSFIMVFVSEIAGASSGIGYRISVAQLAYQADLMIASLLILGLLAMFVDSLVCYMSRRILHYAGR